MRECVGGQGGGECVIVEKRVSRVVHDCDPPGMTPGLARLTEVWEAPGVLDQCAVPLDSDVLTLVLFVSNFTLHTLVCQNSLFRH